MTLLLWVLAAIATATLAVVRRRLQRLEAAMHAAEQERKAAQARETAQTERERFSKELALALQREESVEDFGRVLLSTPSIPSTQEFMRLHSSVAPNGTVLVADQQTQGKGVCW